jgi:hypothetical protein
MMKNSENLIKIGLLIIAIFVLISVFPSIVNAQIPGYVTPYNTTSFIGVNPSGGSYNGYAYNNNNYANTPVYNPTPRIYSMSPSTVNKTSTSFVAVITGDGFIPGSIARVNGVEQMTTYINPSRLEMRLNNLAQMNVGNHIVNVYNPNTNSIGLSNDVTLKINSGTVASTSSTNTKTVAKKDSTSTATVASTKATTMNEGLVAGAIFGVNGGFFPTGLMQWILFFIFILVIIYLWRRIYNTPKYEAIPLKHH